jgi:ribosomal 50S subunit-associated protein YjgA (DUF615 family)
MALTKESAARKDSRTGKAAMQHRHFATIAAIIKTYPDATSNELRQIADHFAKELADTNPNFNAERFKAACLD